MQISVLAETKKLTKFLDQASRKQIPFATSKALNKTAFDVRSSLQSAIPFHIDRPTKAFIKAVQVQTSNKRNLVATVGFVGDGFRKTQWKESPASIAKKQIDGGARRPKGKAIAVPVTIKTNVYGNLGRNKINKLLADKKNFSGVPKGRTKAGIYQRKKNGIKMLVAWKPITHYRGGRLPFSQIATKAVNRRYKKHFEAELNNALRTAK